MLSIQNIKLFLNVDKRFCEKVFNFFIIVFYLNSNFYFENKNQRLKDIKIFLQKFQLLRYLFIQFEIKDDCFHFFK